MGDWSDMEDVFNDYARVYREPAKPRAHEWLCGDGRIIPLENMSEEHLANARNLFRRRLKDAEARLQKLDKEHRRRRRLRAKSKTKAKKR